MPFYQSIDSGKFKNSQFYTHPTCFGVNFILLHIPCHSKICHLTFLSFTNENISCRQVTMDYLQEKIRLVIPLSGYIESLIYDLSFSRQKHCQIFCRDFMKRPVSFFDTNRIWIEISRYIYIYIWNWTWMNNLSGCKWTLKL